MSAMKTIALRFGEHFAPDCGTIAAHQEVIDKQGFVWYGKMGTPVSTKVISLIANNKPLRILLIRSGKAERYWATVIDIQHDVPDREYIPEYYRESAEVFKTWFKVERFDIAEKDVMSQFVVASSGTPLSEVSRHSMSPYFMIEKKDI